MAILSTLAAFPALTAWLGIDQRRPHWQQLAALLVTCAKTGDLLLRAIFTGRLRTQ
jgi:hypothetical protein